jgi:glycosyltransferase involved in cell wall biosynthesis
MQLVNTPTIDQISVEPSVAGREIVMVGRLCPQKDPRFFFDVSELVRSADSSVRFTWIGDGDDHFKSLMSSAGVEVTGWLEKAELTERLTRASVYLHSACYEGFPLSVLDAAAMDLPIVLRDIDCFDGVGLEKVRHPREAAALILRLLDEPELCTSVRARNKALLDSMNIEVQRENINEIYDFAYTKGAESA